MLGAWGLLWRRRRNGLPNEGDERDGVVTLASQMQANDVEERQAADLFQFDIHLTEEDIGA